MNKLIHKVIAAGFGSGYSPLAPGTAGSIVGALILWILYSLVPEYFSGGWKGTPYLLILILLAFGLGVWSANALSQEWGKDPQKVVIDEIAGMWVSMLVVPVSLLSLTLAFILFRIFDIWKPLGIRKAEALSGGWGIMMDDVVAGLYACIVVHLILYFI